jgi:hypothetical protein
MVTMDGCFDPNEGAWLAADRLGHECIGNSVAELIWVSRKNILGG